MKLPSVPAIVQEAALVIAGAALAALIVSQFPRYRAWLAASWAPPKD